MLLEGAAFGEVYRNTLLLPPDLWYTDGRVRTGQ
jgi:hypothetical protein